MLLTSEQRYPSSNIGEMEHLLRINAGATYFDVRGFARNFKFNVNMAPLSNLSLIWSTCNVATTIKYASADFIRQIFPIRQPISVALSETATPDVISKPGYLIPADMPWTLENGSNFESLAIRVEIDALEGCLRPMIGENYRDRLRFETGDKSDPRLTRILRNAVFQFANELDCVRANFSTVALREFEQGLIVKFLLCNSHNYSHILQRETSQGDETRLRRVEEYITVHWGRPLDVRTLAAVSEISERSLFRAFQKRHGLSPYAFVQRLRLQHAHAMLLESSEETTVTAVALKCNFHSFGRFAAAYHRMFGELPSETKLGKRSGRRMLAAVPAANARK